MITVREDGMMIVGLTGRCCSGKTTVFNKLREDRQDFGYVGEPVRDILKDIKVSLRALRCHPEKYLQFQLMVLKRYVEDVCNVYQNYDVVITDRTIYDIYIYSKLYLPYRYFKLFCVEVSLYGEFIPDKLIYFEPLPYVDDGIRHKGNLAQELALFEKYVKPKADVVVNVIDEDYQKIRQKILSVIDNGINNWRC